MGLKTIPFRDIEEKAENMYEAVSAMSGQAKLELQERIVNKAILSHQEEELDVFDEVEDARGKARGIRCCRQITLRLWCGCRIHRTSPQFS